MLHFCAGGGASSLRKSMSKSCQSLVNQNHRLGVRANVRRVKRGAEMKGKYTSATASRCHSSPRTSAQYLARKCTCRVRVVVVVVVVVVVMVRVRVQYLARESA